MKTTKLFNIYLAWMLRARWLVWWDKNTRPWLPFFQGIVCLHTHRICRECFKERICRRLKICASMTKQTTETLKRIPTRWTIIWRLNFLTMSYKRRRALQRWNNNSPCYTCSWKLPTRTSINSKGQLSPNLFWSSSLTFWYHIWLMSKRSLTNEALRPMNAWNHYY